MNPYNRLAPLDPNTVVCDSKGPQWRDAAAIGVGTGFEIRPVPKGLLISFDSSFFDPKAPIPPGKSRVLSVTSPIPWVARSFSVSAECAHRFVLESMRHAMREYVPEHPLPCTLFSDAQCCECRAPKALRHLPKEWPTVMVGCALDIEVRNISDQPSHFRAAFEADRVDFPRHPCL